MRGPYGGDNPTAFEKIGYGNLPLPPPPALLLRFFISDSANPLVIRYFPSQRYYVKDGMNQKQLSQEAKEELASIIASLEPPAEPKTKAEKISLNKKLNELAVDSQIAAQEYRLNSYKKYRCGDCKEVYLRNRENFFKDIGESDGLGIRCISCERERRRLYLNRPGVRDARATKARERLRTPEGRHKSREQRRRYLSRSENRIVFSLRGRLRAIFYYKAKGFKSGSIRSFVGCSKKDLFRHIESLWPPDGSMSWENYGRKAGKITWHIDHIVPYAYFKKDFTSKDLAEVKRVSAIVNHYTNLCPLWGAENLQKSDTLPKWVLFNGKRMTSDLHEKVYGKDYQIHADDD